LAATVILTGIPGVGKTTVLNELQKLAKEKRVTLTVLNYGTVMNELFEKYGRKTNRDEMRKQHISIQKKIQDEAAKILARKVRDSVTIIDTHMFIRTKTGLWSGLSDSVLLRLKPSLMVLVEAPPEEIARRRRSDTTRMRDDLTMEEVRFDIEWSRATASACAVSTGAPVKIISNEVGKQKEAAEELFKLITELAG
jgi:adenylate kinase